MGCNTSQESLQQKDNNENSAAEGDHLKQDIQDINNKEETGLVSIDLNRTEPPPAKEEEEAAVKIQAAFRGHKTRKNINMKQPADVQNEPEPTQQELEAEFRADDVELCHAATRIQASFRGHMARKQVDKKDETQPGQDKPGEEELDIDLSDPELNKAAVKIQASFRGHMVRKENEDTQ